MEIGRHELKVSKMCSHVEVDENLALRRQAGTAQLERRRSVTDSLEAKTPHLHAWWRLEYELILPLTAYNRLLDVATAPEFKLVLALLNATAGQPEVVLQSILRVFESRGQAIPFLLHLAERELETGGTDQSTVFRINTLATKAVVEYLKSFGLDYLRSLLRPAVKRLVRAASSLPEDAPAEAPLPVLEHLKQLWADVSASTSTIPIELRRLFVQLAALVRTRFADRPKASPSAAQSEMVAVNGFLFLRFFCPAILSPKPYGAADGVQVDARVAKALKRIARVMQYLANFKADVKASEGEDGLTSEEARSFLAANRDAMKVFVDDLISPTKLESYAQLPFCFM